MAETHWNKLGAYLKETQILGSIQNTLYWDQNTGMPKKGASWRSEQLTYIAKVLHERNSSEEFSNLIQSAKNELADIEDKVFTENSSISVKDSQFFSDNKHRLTNSNKAMLNTQVIPYNLDAWDGYAYEREVILATAKSVNANLVVLTGDTHNAWASNLTDSFGDIVGVEFATSSVSSPGLEYLEEDKNINLQRAEDGIIKYLENLQYCNFSDRGFMVITFTHEKVQSDWHYVDTILSTNFNENIDRKFSVISSTGMPKIKTL